MDRNRHLPSNIDQRYPPRPRRILLARRSFGEGQLNFPHGFCLSHKGEVVVADTFNHKIQVFKTTGEFLYQFGTAGRKRGCLWYPRKIAVFRTSGHYVVSDKGREGSRLQVFTRTGRFMKRINIQFMNIVAGLATTMEGQIVAVESVTPGVFIFSESGQLLRTFDCGQYIKEPSDIAVRAKEIYICDYIGRGVFIFSEWGDFLRTIRSETVMNFPCGINVGADGDVIIGDSHRNHFHIAVFSRLGTLVAEFECPHLFVNRCWGLKVTSEGYLLTLDKINQFIVMFYPLYIPYTSFEDCLFSMQHLSID